MCLGVTPSCRSPRAALPAPACAFPPPPSRKNIDFVQAEGAGRELGRGGGFAGSLLPQRGCRDSVLLFAAVDLGSSQCSIGTGSLSPAIVGPGLTLKSTANTYHSLWEGV